ncbi:hypothetical protein [Streptomyces sp. NPDC047525]|uniref:hypothetical protein n=1 Tax=Streptomyces sp. NPDC047525 TaxID=3155264 RepID=UPI0033D69BB1
MPIDPYAALHALLRAEAVRNAPGPDATAPAPSQAEDDEDHDKKKHSAEQNGR